MIRKFKLFSNPIGGLSKWLNDMSDKGYRLVRVVSTFYYFEECEKGKYRYAVDYVANKSYDELKKYEKFLNETNIRYMEKAASLGKVAIGNIRLRPYADSGARIAISKGMIKREFLILEKENNGQKFEIYTTTKDKVEALKKVRRPILWSAVFLAYMLFISLVNIPQFRWSWLSYELPTDKKIPTLIFLGVSELLLMIRLMSFQIAVRKIEEEGTVHE